MQYCLLETKWPCGANQHDSIPKKLTSKHNPSPTKNTTMMLCICVMYLLHGGTMTVKAITSQFDHQGISPKEGLSCAISAQAWINQDYVNIPWILQISNSSDLKRWEKWTQGMNQAIHENPHIYVAPVPSNDVTKRTKSQMILPLSKKINLLVLQ